MVRPIDVASNLSGPNVNVALSQPVDRSGAIRGQMAGQAASAQAQALGTKAQSMVTDAQGTHILSGIIPQVTQAGLEVHKGMALADLQQQHNNEIDMFVARKNAGNTAIEMDTSQSLFNRLRDEFGEGAAIQQSSGAMGRFEEKASMLKKALDQGAVSVDELETRLFALTRQAINKNPGLQNELINHAEKILAISGVRSLKDTNQKINDDQQKFFEETRKNLTLDARKYNIPTDSFRMNDPDYLSFVNDQVNQAKGAEMTWKQAQQAQQQGIFLNEEQSKQWIRTNGDKYVQGGLFDFYSAAQGIIAKHGDNHQAAINEIDTLATFQKEAVRSQFSQNGALSNQEGKDTLDRFNTLIDSVNDRAARATTMADLKQGIDNVHSIMSNKEAIGLMKSGINLTAARLTSLWSDELAKWNLRNPERAAKLIRLHGELLDRAFGSATMSTFTGYGGLEEGRSDAVTLLEKPAKLGDMDVFRRMVEGFSTVEKQIDNDQAKMDFFTDLSRTFSRPEYLKFFKEHPDGTLASQAFGMVDRSILNMGAAVKREGAGAVANIMPGGDGIVFDMPEARGTEITLNTKYAKQFNDFIKVYAAMNGTSTKQAFEYVLANRPQYVQLFNIRGADKFTSTSPNVQQKIIGTESGGNPNAKNPNSSATGSAQFINQTWLDVMNKHFGELTEGKSEEQILAMRKNSNLNKLAEQMFRQDNQKVLESAGIPVNDANIYLAHFLGAGTAKKVVQSNPSTPVEQLLSPQVISANKSILQGKTASQLINWANDKMNKSFKV